MNQLRVREVVRTQVSRQRRNIGSRKRRYMSWEMEEKQTGRKEGNVTSLCAGYRMLVLVCVDLCRYRAVLRVVVVSQGTNTFPIYASRDGKIMWQRQETILRVAFRRRRSFPFLGIETKFQLKGNISICKFSIKRKLWSIGRIRRSYTERIL